MKSFQTRDMYDGGITFGLKLFLNDGAPYSKIVGNRPILLNNARRVVIKA